jgi:hypothetical protein
LKIKGQKDKWRSSRRVAGEKGGMRTNAVHVPTLLDNEVVTMPEARISAEKPKTARKKC